MRGLGCCRCNTRVFCHKVGTFPLYKRVCDINTTIVTPRISRSYAQIYTIQYSAVSCYSNTTTNICAIFIYKIYASCMSACYIGRYKPDVSIIDKIKSSRHSVSAFVDGPNIRRCQIYIPCPVSTLHIAFYSHCCRNGWFICQIGIFATKRDCFQINKPLHELTKDCGQLFSADYVRPGGCLCKSWCLITS